MKSLRRRNTLRRKKSPSPYPNPWYFPLQPPQRGMAPGHPPQRRTKLLQTSLQVTRYPRNRLYQSPFPSPPRGPLLNLPFLLRCFQPRLLFPRICHVHPLSTRVQPYRFRILRPMALHTNPDPREPGRATPGVLQAGQALEAGELSWYHGAEE